MNTSSKAFVIGPTVLSGGDIQGILAQIGYPQDCLAEIEVAEGYRLIEPGQSAVTEHCWEVLYEYLNHGQFHADRYSLEIPIEDFEVPAYREAARNLQLTSVTVGYPECRNDCEWVLKGDRYQVAMLLMAMRQPIRLP